MQGARAARRSVRAWAWGLIAALVLPLLVGCTNEAVAPSPTPAAVGSNATAASGPAVTAAPTPTGPPATATAILPAHAAPARTHSDTEPQSREAHPEGAAKPHAHRPRRIARYARSGTDP